MSVSGRMLNLSVYRRHHHHHHHHFCNLFHLQHLTNIGCVLKRDLGG